MKPNIQHLAAVLGLAVICPASRAAEEKKPVREERKELRVITGPERERRVFIHDGERSEKPEMESVAFLGVEASPVSAALGSQLGLPRGTGLVVGHVAPKSPAAGVLQEHDVLLKLDDQLLIETRQLAVLVRTHKEGDEVTITYLRVGQKATAKVKLATHQVPKFAGGEGGGAGWSVGGIGGGRVEFAPVAPGSERQRAEVDRLLSMMHRAPDGDPIRIQIDRRDGPGIRAMSINTGNSNLVFSDTQGALELSTKDGIKSLVAKGPDGQTIFSGPVTTPDERKALPPELRERLEKLEGMRDITFKTDGEFKGVESRVVRPLGRGISLPPAPVQPENRRSSI